MRHLRALFEFVPAAKPLQQHTCRFLATECSDSQTTAGADDSDHDGRRAGAETGVAAADDLGAQLIRHSNGRMYVSATCAGSFRNPTPDCKPGVAEAMEEAEPGPARPADDVAGLGALEATDAGAHCATDQAVCGTNVTFTTHEDRSLRRPVSFSPAVPSSRPSSRRRCERPWCGWWTKRSDGSPEKGAQTVANRAAGD